MDKYLRQINQLLKMVTYILGRRPDEFGLVPDENGYVKIKDLIKALCEEKGWRHIRQKNIQQLFTALPNPPLENRDQLIRAKNREHLPPVEKVLQLPGLLYTCVRKRAYPAVVKNGISGFGGPRVILASKPDMAERIGRRYDHQAVMVTVHTKHCLEQKIEFYRCGELLFWAGKIPPDCFTGPPLPQENKEAPKKVVRPHTQPEPGSVILDSDEKFIGKKNQAPHAKKRDKYDKKGHKKIKRKRRPPPWRS